MKTMRRILQLISWIALIATALPSILFLQGSVDLDGVKRTMLVATIVWFMTTPLWMGRKVNKASHPFGATEIP